VILGGVLASGAATSAAGTAPASQASSPSSISAPSGAASPSAAQTSPAVIFGGLLANAQPAWRQASPVLSSYAASAPGAQLNISV
jgi:hypothetical protein